MVGARPLQGLSSRHAAHPDSDLGGGERGLVEHQDPVPGGPPAADLHRAAQAPVDLDAMAGQGVLDEMGAYAQSRLAITIWSRELASELDDGPVVVAVNPGSLLASKMVKEGFGIEGKDIQAAWLGTVSSFRTGQPLADALKLDYIPISRVENACATATDAFRNACYAVTASALREHRMNDLPALAQPRYRFNTESKEDVPF